MQLLQPGSQSLQWRGPPPQGAQRKQAWRLRRGSRTGRCPLADQSSCQTMSLMFDADIDADRSAAPAWSSNDADASRPS